MKVKTFWEDHINLKESPNFFEFNKQRQKTGRLFKKFEAFSEYICIWILTIQFFSWNLQQSIQYLTLLSK